MGSRQKTNRHLRFLSTSGRLQSIPQPVFCHEARRPPRAPQESLPRLCRISLLQAPKLFCHRSPYQVSLVNAALTSTNLIAQTRSRRSKTETRSWVPSIQRAENDDGAAPVKKFAFLLPCCVLSS